MKRIILIAVLTATVSMNGNNVQNELRKFTTDLQSLGIQLLPAPIGIPSTGSVPSAPSVSMPSPIPAPSSPATGSPIVPSPVTQQPSATGVSGAPPAPPALPSGQLYQPPKKLEIKKGTGAQPSGQPAAQPGDFVSELTGRLKRRPQSKAPGRVQPGAPVQPSVAQPRRRVMRGVQEEWQPTVHMPHGNVEWLDYNLDRHDSEFGNVVHYNGIAANTTINAIKTALGNSSYTQEEGIRISRDAEGSLKQSVDELAVKFARNPVQQENIGSITEDKRRQLLDAMFVAVSVAPVSISSSVVYSAIETLALEGQYEPGMVFSYVSDMYVGGSVNALRAELDREIRNKGIEELQGIVDSKRTQHIRILARRIITSLNRLHNGLRVYENYKDNFNISLLDKDLFLSKLLCSWRMVEQMYHEIQEILTPDEYTKLKASMGEGLSEQFSFVETSRTSVETYIQATAQRLNGMLQTHQRPLIDVFQVLDALNDRATTAEPLAHLVEFIFGYLPEVPNQLSSRDGGGSVDYEDQVNQQKEALLQSFIRCNYHSYDTQEKLDEATRMLDQVISKLNDAAAIERVEAVKNYIVDFRQQFIRNKKVNKLLQRIQTDPELSAQPEKIKEVIDDISQMAQNKDLAVKEAQALIEALRPRYDIIAFAKGIAADLGQALISICHQGKRDPIVEIIQKSIYQNEKYVNPQIEMTKIVIANDGTVTETTETVEITGDELSQIQVTILQSIVAYLTTVVYKDEVYKQSPQTSRGTFFCARCTYNGAWLIADDLDEGGTMWVDVLKSLPYNDDGNVNEQGLPSGGGWYPVTKFTQAFKPLYSSRP